MDINTPAFQKNFAASFTATYLQTSTLTSEQISSSIPKCIPQNNNQEIGFVMHVVDGDTINALINDQINPVRYIGINTPESGDSSLQE